MNQIVQDFLQKHTLYKTTPGDHLLYKIIHLIKRCTFLPFNDQTHLSAPTPIKYANVDSKKWNRLTSNTNIWNVLYTMNEKEYVPYILKTKAWMAYYLADAKPLSEPMMEYC